MVAETRSSPAAGPAPRAARRAGRGALRRAGREYEAEDRGFELVQVAGGWRFQSHPDLAAYVERFVLEGQSARLSGAALETLAIVAYKQPVSRAQVAAIRGVNVDGVCARCSSGATSPRWPATPARARPCCSAPRRCSSSGSASTRSTELPPLGEFVPGADVVEALEQGLRLPAEDDLLATPRRDRGRQRQAADGPEIDLDEVDPDDPTGLSCPTRASGSRRCWPGPGSAAGGSART